MGRAAVLASLVAGAVACDGTVDPPTARRALATGALTLVGTGDSACSRPQGTADVWCAFGRPGDDEGAAEIWVVNVSARGAVSCDAPGPGCLRLTRNAWAGGRVFETSYPAIDEFRGETLYIYENSGPPPRSKGAGFVGPILAWRPGWTAARRITSDRGYTCRGSLTAPVASCLDDVVQTDDTAEFGLLAGTLDAGRNGPLPSVGRIAGRGAGGQVMWGSAFSPSGDEFAFSSPTADGTGEVLRVVRTADVGRAAPTELATGTARWRLSSDGKRVYYLAGFNYDERSAKPSGTLVTIGFPGGGAPQTLQERVGDFLPVGSAGQPDQGVGLLQDMQGGFGTLRLIRDPAHPAEAVTIAAGVSEYQLTSDLRWSYVFRPSAPGGREGAMARTDGQGSLCPLNTRPGSLPFLVGFVEASPFVVFAEDSVDHKALAFYTDATSCGEKHVFATFLSYLRPARRHVIHGVREERQSKVLTLRDADLGGAGVHFPEDGGGVVDRGVGKHVAVAGERWVVYTVEEGDAPGLYVYGPLH